MIEKIQDILDVNNTFFTFFKKLGWVFLLNIMFIITSIPIVTVGASVTGMYAVMNKLIQEREFHFFKDYFGTFKENFWRATVIWFITAIITIILYLNIHYVFFIMTGGFAYVMRVGTVIICVGFCMFANMAFPLITRFDINLKEIIPMMFTIISEHILLSLESVLFTLIILGGSLWIVATGSVLGFFVLIPFIALGLHAFVQSYVYKAILDNYAEEEETDPDVVLK